MRGEPRADLVPASHARRCAGGGPGRPSPTRGSGARIAMIGETLGGAKILELIGGGGFAAVYLARDLRSNATVAVKVLHPHFARNPTVVRRFLEEAQTAQRLTGPHVVRVLHADQQRGTFYIVMEYVQ